MIFAFCIFSTRGLFLEGRYALFPLQTLQKKTTEKIFFVCSQLHVVGGFAHYFGMTLQF